MRLNVVFRAEALADLDEGFRWYEGRLSGLGIEFLRAVEACLAKTARNPLANRKVRETVRRALVRRFPYEIFYEVEGQTLVILACTHARRHPNHWWQRQ